jgi:hypothetical protein
MIKNYHNSVLKSNKNLNSVYLSLHISEWYCLINDDWFYEKTAKMPIKVYDRSLKDEFLKEVLWGKRIRLK